MKYSLAGHFCVQEVDKMHQENEVVIRVTEFYSPLSFLRILLKVNTNRFYRVLQMKSENFKEFQNSLKMLQFSNSTIYHAINRRSHQRCSVWKSTLKSFKIYTGKHLCQSLFFIKVAGFIINFINYNSHSLHLFSNNSFVLVIKSLFPQKTNKHAVKNT